MEIDKTVRILKNCFTHVEQSIPCQFKTVTAKHPNAEECLQNLFKEMESKGFFQLKNKEQFRKLHFLFLLNTNLGLADELECNVDVGHTVGAVPQLNPYVYFMISYKFNLLKFLLEIIEWGPLSLAIKILVMVNSEIRHLNLTHYFDFLTDALNATFYKFMKTNSELVSKNLFEYFQILLLHYKEDDTFIVKDFQYRKRNGYKWLSLIKLLHSMTRCYFNLNTEGKPTELYDITLANNPEDELISKTDVIEKCYGKVFYKCRDFGEFLDIDMFMAWHEVAYDNEKTLQNIIGEEAYYVRAMLERYKDSGKLPDYSSELIAMLQSVQLKPQITQIEDKKFSRTELELKIFEITDFDESFLKVVEDFLKEDVKKFNYETSKTFIHKLCFKTPGKETNNETAKNIILLLLQSMELEQLISFVKEFLCEYGLEHILYEPSVDLIPLLELVNSFQADEAEEDFNVLKDITLLALRSTYYVLKALITFGCSENDNQMKIVKILDTLRSFCLYSTHVNSSSIESTLLNFILRDFLLNDYAQLSVIERRNFQNLILTSSSKDLINKNFFFCECLLTVFSVTENFERETMPDLLILLTEFTTNFHLEINFPVHTLLIALAQILDASRWSMATFSSEKLKICEEGIRAIKLLLQLYSSTLNSKEIRNELEKSLDKLSEFTKYYFHNVCPSLLRNTLQSQLISLIHKPLIERTKFLNKYSENENIFIFQFAEILPLCTFNELESVVNNYTNEKYKEYTFIFDLITNSISFVSNCAFQYSLVSDRDSNQIFSCLGQMINNFLIILQKSNITCKKAKSKVNFIKYANRIAVVLQVFPPHLIHTYEFNLIKFINEFFENSEFIANNLDALVGSSNVEHLDEEMRQLLVGLLLL